MDSATFYVDAIGGNDNNNGTEQDKVWKTLAKVNSVTFQPGDQLLFKADGIWNGSLRPQGSGEAGNPIVIGQYGEGEVYP